MAKTIITPILELKGISKSFGGVHALTDVYFSLQPGEIHALIGENGAGKSTLMKIIAGVHQPDSGEIIIKDQIESFHNPLVSQNHGIAAIYQEPTLYMDLDIAENIFMGHHPQYPGIPYIKWKEMHQEAARLISLLGKQMNVYSKVRGLSIAQMQIVEMAKALSMNARILIMDEPTSALTQNEVADLFHLIRKLKLDGVAVIFISHRLEEVFEIADCVTIFRDGRFVDTKFIKETSENELIRLMVGRTLDTLFPKKQVPITDEMLRVEGLCKNGLFRNISFSLHKGEILGLSGLVGARRTEVAQAIFGINPPDQGKIWIQGKLKEIDSPNAAMKEGMAYVPEDRQMHGLILGMGIKENITLTVLRQFVKLALVDNNKEGEFASGIAQQLEIKTAGLWQKAQELSGGNQQKAVLAKWLGTKPKILILDEPTRGIDVGTKAAVHQLMGDLAEQGVAILMISSELPEIIGMSDRVLVMCEGNLTGEFSRAEATQEKIMKAATRRSVP